LSWLFWIAEYAILGVLWSFQFDRKGWAGVLRLHVVVLIHERDDFDPSQYLMLDVVRVLRERGARVSVLQGCDGAQAERLLCEASGDGSPLACVVHVDLTRVPQEHLALAKRFPVTINLGAWDIAKRAISQQVVTKGDEYAGPVIVKTDNNCGGLKEAQRTRDRLTTRCIHAVHSRLHWTMRSELAAKAYRLYQHSRDVPWTVWMNRALVVERFTPEFRDGKYFLRSWVFMGEEETLSLRWSSQPIVALPHVDGRCFLEPTPEHLPEELRARRRELGFDFGKFDYALVDGRAVLYDANRTPTNRTMTPEQVAWQSGKLADGLEKLVLDRIVKPVDA